MYRSIIIFGILFVLDTQTVFRFGIFVASTNPGVVGVWVCHYPKLESKKARK